MIVEMEMSPIIGGGMIRPVDLSMSGATLKVSTEVMYAKAQEAENQLGRMRQSFDTMQTMVTNSANYWQGEAGETHRATYQTLEKRAQEIFKRLQEHISDLRQMAAGYDTAEKQAAAQIDVLSSDAIL